MKTSNFLAILITASLMLFNFGCGIEEPLERVEKTPGPYYGKLPYTYHNIHIKQSTSTQVLEIIKQNKKELVSQSPTVIASFGEKKRGVGTVAAETYAYWITLAAFNEDDLTVTRKYYMASDEKPWFIGDKGMKQRFDAQIVMDDKTLKEAYPSENQKRIALLKKSLEHIRDDFAQVRKDSTTLDTGAMMINQTFERILYVLSQSPALAQRLSEPKGLQFDHPTLGENQGHIRMTLEGNVVTIKLRIGWPFWQIWKDRKKEATK